MKKTGILLLNLGTPDSPSVKDVRKYLTEFLNDPRVIDSSAISRFLLVNGLIVPLRAPKSAKEYAKIFKIGNGKSPLLTYTQELALKVSNLCPSHQKVYFAMRYGNPSMDTVLAQMQKENFEKIILFPLYPHYASASTGSTLEKAFKIIQKWWAIPEIKVIGQFYNDSEFISCIVNRMKAFNLDNYDHIIFSYHGLPKRQVDKIYNDSNPCQDHHCEEEINDSNQLCYKATCYETTRLIAEKTGIDKNKISTTFQSRLGKTPWIEPYTDQEIIKLAKGGKKKMLILSPAFVADCLETTIECAQEYFHLFQSEGGEVLDLVPSLNAEDDWCQYVAGKISE